MENVKIPEWAMRFRNSGKLDCCATCEHYVPEVNKCDLFNQEVPADHLLTFGECQSWKDNIPF